MRKIPQPLIYVAVIALLSGYIYFFERGPVKTDKKDEKKVQVFSGYVADDIQKIKIENLTTTVTAQKAPIVIKKDDKEVWRITAPRDLKADELTIRGILSLAADLNPETVIENPGNLADYGLSKPSARSSFISKSGCSYILTIGDKNAVGSSVYVTTSLKKDVYLLPSNSVDGLRKNINDYRDKSFFKTDSVLAKRIKVVRKGKTVVFEKNKENAWEIIAPMKAAADDQKLRDLLNAVNNLKITGYPNDHPANLAVYGLAKPHAGIEVFSSDGKTTNEILLGREKLKAGEFFAMLGGSPSVYMVNKYFDATLDIKLSDYRDKNMMKLDASMAKTLTVQHNGKTYVYQKGEKGQWSCAGRVKSQDEATYLTNMLSNMTVMDFPDKKEASGLKQPTYIVDILLNSAETRTYRFGNTQKEKVFLASDRNKEIYLVSAGVVSQMDLYFNAILTPVAVSSPASTKK